MDIYSIAGWVGMVLIVIAYYNVTVGRWGTHTKLDEVFNIAGSILVGANVYHAGVWPAFTLQIVWMVIAVGNLMKKQKTA